MALAVLLQLPTWRNGSMPVRIKFIKSRQERVKVRIKASQWRQYISY